MGGEARRCARASVKLAILGALGRRALQPNGIAPIGYAYIGKSWFTSGPYLDGQIDEFRIYNRALSAAEVLALAQ